MRRITYRCEDGCSNTEVIITDADASTFGSKLLECPVCGKKMIKKSDTPAVMWVTPGNPVTGRQDF